MIFRIINKEKGSYKYIFTGRHIYCYIHAIAETTNALIIANKIIIMYDNKTDVKINKIHLMSFWKIVSGWLASHQVRIN